MPQISSSHFFLFLLLSLYYTLVSGIESEAQALLAWRSSLKYPANLTKWSYHSSSDPCNWHGIKCNVAGNIRSISYTGCIYDGFDTGFCDGPPIDGTLAKFNFSSLPDLIAFEFVNNNLHGEIPEGIGNLQYLETLRLAANSLTGQFPTTILNLSNIKYVNLSENKFTGVIPREILKLSNLLKLQLSYNNFTGKIPTSLGNLSRLSFLGLRSNKFTGIVPREIGNLHNLETLDLSWNSLTGRFPTAILNLSNIKNLFLEDNEFTGVIPRQILRLSNLRVLYLSSNNFTGEIPTTIGKLTVLHTVDLSNNELEGEIANNIAQVPKLTNLLLGNNHLTGSITYLGNNNCLEFVHLSNNMFIGTLSSFICGGGHLTDLYASFNYFDNLLPITLRNCTSLEFLDLSDNNIKADISHIFGNHPYLRYVNLSRNRFYGRLPSKSHGELPGVFLNMTRAEVINLDRNNLVGEVPPELTSSPYLSILILSNNKFSSLPMINGYNLSSVHLNNNNFSGGFPLLTGNWTSLVTLDIGENNFSGEIPSEIGSSFPILKILRLRSNRFNGTIPSSLSKLNDLQLLDLSKNNFVGPIPHIFSNMSSMMIVKSSSNKSYMELGRLYIENIDVVWKGQRVTFQRTLDLLTGIDLSCNFLSGEIPEDLMKLQGLVFLNLSRNQLNGAIPHNIGNLTWLEVLDLSMNHLSKSIPVGISHLTHLAMLNLSHNKLTGQIPLGSQIQTFDPSAFSDNDDLCGSPLLINCSTHDNLVVPLLDNKGDHKIEVIWITCSAILGFIIGFWVYFGALFWEARLRFAIFRFTDELQDKMMKWCAS